MPVVQLKNERGFTYIAALMIVVVMGIMLGAAGQTWTTAMKREREEELIFRGMQIQSAIARWHGRGQDPRRRHPVTPLNELKHLLKDPRSLETVRYLPRLYMDPMTGKDFEIVKDSRGSIIGVRSTSNVKPLKQGNFPAGMKHLEAKAKYSDWIFVDTKTFPNAITPTPAAPPGG